MEHERKSRQIHRSAVIRGKVRGGIESLPALLDRHLAPLKLDAVFPGLVDYGIAESVCRTRRSIAVARAGSRRQVMQVFLQLKVGQFTGTHLPTRHGREREHGQHYDNVDSPHGRLAQDDMMTLGKGWTPAPKARQSNESG